MCYSFSYTIMKDSNWCWYDRGKFMYFVSELDSLIHVHVWCMVGPAASVMDNYRHRSKRNCKKIMSFRQDVSSFVEFLDLHVLSTFGQSKEQNNQTKTCKQTGWWFIHMTGHCGSLYDCLTKLQVKRADQILWESCWSRRKYSSLYKRKESDVRGCLSVSCCVCFRSCRLCALSVEGRLQTTLQTWSSGLLMVIWERRRGDMMMRSEVKTFVCLLFF